MHEGGASERLQEVLRRLEAILPSRVGPKAAAEMLLNFGRMAEPGMPPATALQSLLPALDLFEQRQAIASPWGGDRRPRWRHRGTRRCRGSP